MQGFTEKISQEEGEGGQYMDHVHHCYYLFAGGGGGREEEREGIMPPSPQKKLKF